VRKWTTTEKTLVANSSVVSSATRHVRLRGVSNVSLLQTATYERLLRQQTTEYLLGDYHINSINVFVRCVILLRVAFSRSCLCFDFQACNRRSERKYVKRSALRQRIVQVDFDVSVSNDSYENLFRQLTHDIFKIVRVCADNYFEQPK